MRKLLVITVVFASGWVLGLYVRGGSPTAVAGVAKCSSRNGDVNADGKVDIADAVTILGYLFLGSPTELVPTCTQLSIMAGLADTGQTKCQDQEGNEIPCDSAPCRGQDGFYHTGCLSEARFIDNGDGTVTDHCTGLMWQKDTADVSVDGHVTDDRSDALTWCDALAYCENLSFAGHDDWRLPNVGELQSIVDYGRFGPAIDPAFGSLSSVYWSSTTYAAFPDRAWFVHFDDGLVSGGAGKDGNDYVRAVRNAP
jgi:hypothetical protein